MAAGMVSVGSHRETSPSFAESVQIDVAELREDHRVLKFAGRGIASAREGDGARVLDRQQTGAPFGRKRARRFFGVAGDQVALFVPIERDNDEISDVHGVGRLAPGRY